MLGDVALDPGTIVELLPIQVDGDINISDTDTNIADSDLNTAYVIVANTAATEIVGTVNLGARITPYLAGVYQSGSDLLLDVNATMTCSAGWTMSSSSRRQPARSRLAEEAQCSSLAAHRPATCTGRSVARRPWA